jgi:hypothetical protein
MWQVALSLEAFELEKLTTLDPIGEGRPLELDALQKFS